MASTISAGTTSGTAIAIAGDTTGNLAFQTNGTTTAMTINTSQNVGIGTTSPSEKLHISGSGDLYAKVESTGTQAGIKFKTTTSGTSEYGILADSTDALRFYDFKNSGERMRIDSSGNVYINTTTQNDSGKLNINYNSTTNIGIGIKQTNGGTTGTLLNFFNSTNQTGSITQNNTNVAFNTSSDYRLKDNIVPMTGALGKVAQLKPVTYRWKYDGSSGQGFIAHELQEVVPEAVTGEKDSVDADGKPVYQGIDTSFLVATLTAAIQELNAKVEAQSARIAELEGAK